MRPDRSRAEPHDTPPHLSEYASLDAELGFITDHCDVMRVARDAIAGMVDAVRQRAATAAGALDLSLPAVPGEIPAIHFAEASN